jgi:6-phosphofructokinase 1
MNEIEIRARGEFELRNVVLGHTQRGENPNAEDRTLAKRYGVAAIEAYDAGMFGQMVRLKDTVMGTCPIAEATHTLKLVTEDAVELHVAERLGIFMHG